ncbi:hypothetical protein FOXG_11715 [Fusarium oxysporum f. sp. lycopersici 4287]|uniref:DUF1772-domain-containing protein n=3 Tax=Fusarium oxysporum TaxID=5507 RepID=A0A0J9VLX5_FUSO4|nr:hypothetical protein FOXG_11715 [Fusarium oxysporum f. sp. lycopersici 4287]EXK29771.1 hypothetical protein FOMG_14202 [Fusarium oxysporum f. sp. melonis 26406]KAJ9418777.1 hypothetical protein QL093DRAFT_2392206 [Fusarium oxysporum]KNB12033.1 hypothetical protein FOXG_11715 [Fusarium oxysporum f. sp. lycopersici 4287]
MSTVEIISISTALMASGGIATLTFFDVPELQSQPASRSLPSIRWLFSRGSHVFPSASLLSTIGFIYSASSSNFPGTGPLYAVSTNTVKANTFLTAAALAFSIAPFTQLMIPTNFTLIKENNKLGGTRSEKASEYDTSTGRSAWESVKGTDEGFEFADLSGPQEQTERESTVEEDEKVRELLERFRWLNLVRAVLIGAGGVVGLYAATS